MLNVLLSTAAQAALFGPELIVNQVVPPAEPVETETVAMGSFEGPQSSKLQDFLQEQLLDSDRGSYRADALTLSDGLTAKVLRIVPAAESSLVVSATVSTGDLVEEDYTKDGVKIVNGQKTSITYSCRKRELTTAVRMSLTAAGGELLGQHEQRTSEKSSICKESRGALLTAIGNGELPSEAALTEAALRALSPALVADFAPHWEARQLNLMVDKLTRAAGKMAKKGNLTGAVAAWESVLAEDPYNQAATFNLGVIAEAYGHLDDAESWYTKAAQLQAARSVDKALARVASRRTELAGLAAYGLVHSPPDLPMSSGGAVASSADKVSVKGGKNARVALLTSPEEGSGVLVQLPGGLEVTRLEELDGWVKVSTPDGTEGFLPAQKVK